MAKTNIDEIIEYPTKILNTLGEDVQIVGFLRDKSFDSIIDDDKDYVRNNYMFDFMYLTKTVQQPEAYIFVEVEIPRVQNRQIKDVAIYVNVVCHKDFMKLNRTKFKGVDGNRRDNLTRHVHRILTEKISDIFGIGKLDLRSLKTISVGEDFTARELEFLIPEFNDRRLTS